MICTTVTLIDPVVIRLMFWAAPTPTWNYQRFTFGLTDAVLIALIWLERNGRAGRRVFPAMLAVFVLAQLPALLFLTNHPLWQSEAGSHTVKSQGASTTEGTTESSYLLRSRGFPLPPSREALRRDSP